MDELLKCKRRVGDPLALVSAELCTMLNEVAIVKSHKKGRKCKKSESHAWTLSDLSTAANTFYRCSTFYATN